MTDFSDMDKVDVLPMVRACITADEFAALKAAWQEATRSMPLPYIDFTARYEIDIEMKKKQAGFL